jgi:hypothetical protein
LAKSQSASRPNNTFDGDIRQLSENGLVHFRLVGERRERPRTLAVEEHQVLVGVIELALGGSAFAVSVTLSFAEAEQCQANGSALYFFLAKVAIGGPAENAIGAPTACP